MINKTILMGRVTKDIELRHTSDGTPVCSFTLAVDNGYGENKKTDFINCVAWNKTAEFVKNWFGKGRMMAVIGRLGTRSWETEDGKKHFATEVVVHEVHFCESKSASEQAQKSAEEEFSLAVDDDCPF